MNRLGRDLCLGFALATFVACAPAALAQTQDQQQSPAQEQPRHRHMMSPDERLQMLTKQLDLTSDEQAKIKTILENEQKQMGDLRNDSTLAREDRFQKMRDIHEKATKDIRSALDEKQQKKFDNMEKEQRDRMRERRGGMGPGLAG